VQEFVYHREILIRIFYNCCKIIITCKLMYTVFTWSLVKYEAATNLVKFWHTALVCYKFYLFYTP